MIRATSPRNRTAVAVVAAALLLGACGVSTSSEGTAIEQGPDTTVGRTEKPDGGDDDTTTTEEGGGGDDDTTTTTERRGSSEVTERDLEALLPTAEDLGTGWKIDTAADDDDDDDSGFDDATADQCPELSDVEGDEDDGDGEEVGEAYLNGDFVQVEVELNTGATEIPEEELQDVVDAINDCGEITTEDDTFTTTIEFSAELFTDLGDQGYRLNGTITLDADELPEPIVVNTYIIAFRHGEVGIQVQGSDGLDERTFVVTAIDEDDVLALAEEMDTRVGDLVD